MGAYTPAASDELAYWLSALPEVPGVRPLDRLPLVRQRSGRSAHYRRRGAPGDSTAPRVAQDIYSLVREAGVLRWRPGAAAPGGAGPQSRAGPRAALPTGEVIKQYAFERLESSQVYSALTALDRLLTPMSAGAVQNGLRRLRKGLLEPYLDPSKAAGKKVLLIVHGTFSNSEALISNGLQRKPAGSALLADAERKYDLVLCFDHPTLSVSPMLNAFDLAALLRPSPASIDMVCHSRGGLVARWFCEAYADAAMKRRVVFVGSPLAGTSLAAAPRLKHALDLLTNIADAMRLAGEASTAAAYFSAASGLLRVLGAVTGAALNTPLLDAAVALVPGLDAQSRTGNNQELLRLRANTGGGDFASAQIRYFSVVSNFEPQAIGWNFLRLFSKPMQRLGDWAADLVFQGANDLIVDTASMAETADQRAILVAHDFGTNDRVHHLNYFVQAETVRALRMALEIKTAA